MYVQVYYKQNTQLDEDSFLYLFPFNIFFDNFSSANLTKIDGQVGYSSATPSQGNGTGACAGVSCIPVSVVAKTMNFTNFTSCTQAINPVDGTLATGDGPGKSFGNPILKNYRDHLFWDVIWEKRYAQ